VPGVTVVSGVLAGARAGRVLMHNMLNMFIRSRGKIGAATVRNVHVLMMGVA
jgi:hypothetical protein